MRFRPYTPHRLSHRAALAWLICLATAASCGGEVSPNHDVACSSVALPPDGFHVTKPATLWNRYDPASIVLSLDEGVYRAQCNPAGEYNVAEPLFDPSSPDAERREFVVACSDSDIHFWMLLPETVDFEATLNDGTTYGWSGAPELLVDDPNGVGCGWTRNMYVTATLRDASE